MKKALMLHAWYSSPEDGWYPWLKKELEKKGYQVFLPDLPTMRSDLPKMELQLKKIDRTLSLDKNTVVIGHSLGGVLALRLAERRNFNKMILVSGWDFDDLTEGHRLFWRYKISHKKIRKNVEEICCLHADNDPYITAFQAEEMSKRLGGKFILIKGAGHFTEKEGISKIPEILWCL
jgi:predicted alpha/beta hydrolase family esterase